MIFFWGLVRYIYSAGEGEHREGRDLMLWGLLALFVLFSIYGILRVLDNEFLSGAGLRSETYGNPATGQGIY